MGDESLHNRKINRKLISYGILAFIISAAVFSSYFIISDAGVIWNFIMGILRKFMKAVTPLIIGIILAYLFDSPVMFFERLLGKVKWKRVLSITILYIIIIGILTAVINFVVPKVVESLTRLIYVDLPHYSSILTANFHETIEWLKSLNINVNDASIQDYVKKFSGFSTLLLNGIIGFAAGLTQGIMNLFLAMVLAFYILQNKEKLLGSIRELIILYSSKRMKRSILAEAKEVDSILSGYISGMLIDALIVCILDILVLKLIGHRYFLLMGISIGLLNLIPYFGALFGCIAACLLALFQGVPIAVYTLIAVQIVQQLDGNIIQPRIIGDKVGLEPLWVITAVLVFGAFWGILGMIIAVPFAALIKAVIKRAVDRRREYVTSHQNSEESL